MKAALENLANTPPDAIDRKQAISLVLGYLGSSLKGVHEERDYLADDAETRMHACIARAAASQLQAPTLFAHGQTRVWSHVHCTDNLQPYKKHKTKIKDLMRLLGLRLFVCPEPLLSPSDYAALFNANILVVSPASFIEQLAIGLQFYEQNPFSLLQRRFTLSCDLGANQPAPLGPPKKFRLFPCDEMLRFATDAGKDLPGRSFRKPVAPRPLTDHAELNYQVDFMQFATGLEWNQRYLPAENALLAARDKQGNSSSLALSSRVLGKNLVTAPGYFVPRYFENNVSAFMDRFGLDLEQKGIEEIERELPEIYRQAEKSLISMANLVTETSSPLNRLIDFHFRREVSAWMCSAYWRQFSELWQELIRLVDSRPGSESGSPDATVVDTQALTDLEVTFKRKLRERLLQSPYLAQA